MFYKADLFPKLSTIKLFNTEIKKELVSVLNKPIRELYESTWAGERPNYLTNPVDTSTAWKTYTFRFFGIDHKPNLDSCPTIKKILHEIPEIVTAEFSLLEPDTHILPHRGYSNQVLRAHLGLLVPIGDIGIRVNNETKVWTEGGILIFDDSLEHEAWNKTKKQRVVFMFDFEPNFNLEKAKAICKEVLQKTNDSHILNIAPRKDWLHWLELGEFPYIK